MDSEVQRGKYLCADGVRILIEQLCVGPIRFAYIGLATIVLIEETEVRYVREKEMAGARTVPS